MTQTNAKKGLIEKKSPHIAKSKNLRLFWSNNGRIKHQNWYHLQRNKKLHLPHSLNKLFPCQLTQIGLRKMREIQPGLLEQPALALTHPQESPFAKQSAQKVIDPRMPRIAQMLVAQHAVLDVVAVDIAVPGHQKQSLHGHVASIGHVTNQHGRVEGLGHCPYKEIRVFGPPKIVGSYHTKINKKLKNNLYLYFIFDS